MLRHCGAKVCLSSYGVREADLVNTSGKHLLGGPASIWLRSPASICPASIFLDGQLIGGIDFRPTVMGQHVQIGFGIDRQVRTRRELVSRKTSISGGNRRIDVVYRLVVSNFSDGPVSVHLVDRIPLAPDDGSISVRLDDDAAKQLSRGGIYRRLGKPTGILRFDLDVDVKQRVNLCRLKRV